MKISKITILSIVGVLVFVNVLLNVFMQTERDSFPVKFPVVDEVKNDEIKEHSIISHSPVKRKSRLVTERGQYWLHVFYHYGKVIAQYKQVDGEVFDRVGEIPNGKVEFLNETTKVFGYEHWQSGEYHEEYVEFFKTGEKKKEVQYFYGKAVSLKEYFKDGSIRIEQSFAGAVWGNDENFILQGIGVMYRSDGSIDREWNFSGDNGERFVKIYDLQGRVSTVSYYDANGHIIENAIQ